MKIAALILSILSLGAVISIQAGCSSDEPGATNTLGSYTTNFDSTPDKVTTAASKACEDLKLSDINSSGSKVDGKVTAKTSEGTEVMIDIAQAGDNVSKVTIRVGATGDDAVSKQLADRIKSHLSWL
jgi:Protein of unknown function (DUF3568)